MEHSESARSFRDNYQEYILLQQKSSVLVDDYHEKKMYADTRAAEGRRSLEHTKQLLSDFAEFVPIEEALNTVNESITDLNQHHTHQNPYSSTIMELRKLDGKYDFDTLTADIPVPHNLLHTVQQHQRVMSSMPRKPSTTCGVAGNQTSWSVVPSFCEILDTPVADVTEINSFSDQAIGLPPRRHVHSSSAMQSEVRDSINWVTFLAQRERFHTISTRREMAAKVEAEKKGASKGGRNAQDETDQMLLSHHLREEDGGSPEDPETGDGDSPDMRSSIPEAQRVLQEALGEVSQEELLESLYTRHMELQLSNPARIADNVDETEHVATLAGVIVDHFMRSVSHAVEDNRAQAASVYEVTVKQGAVKRIQCSFRQARARRRLQSLRAQKRVMDALQVLMSELGRTDVKSLSIAQADIQAMEKVASTGGLGMGMGMGGGLGLGVVSGSGAKGSSARSPSPSLPSSKLDFKHSSSPYSRSSSYASPGPGSLRTPGSSGSSIYNSGSKSSSASPYADYKQSGSGLPPCGTKPSPAASTPGYSASEHNCSEGSLSEQRDSSISISSNASSQLVITTAINTQANTSLTLPLEIMNTNFVSPKNATNVMENIPNQVPAPETAVLPSKGILFASPLTEEHSISPDLRQDNNVPSAPVGGSGATAGAGPNLSGGLGRGDDTIGDVGAAPRSQATISTGRNGALIITSLGTAQAPFSNSLATAVDEGPTIEIPRGRTNSEQDDLEGESKAPSLAGSPRGLDKQPQPPVGGRGGHGGGRARK